MHVRSKILSDMQDAVKKGDRLRRTVTRMLLSELNYAESVLPAAVEIDDSSSLQVIRNYYNKLLKDVDQYSDIDHKRDVQNQLVIVAQYLPPKSESRMKSELALREA